MSTITDLTAAILSQASYTSYNKYLTGAVSLTQYLDANGTVQNLPAGWQVDISNSGINAADPNFATDQFITFVNSSTKQVVMTFRGTDPTNGVDLKSDLADSGAAIYTTLKSIAATKLNGINGVGGIKNTYAGYTIMTDGHSLGGGMAQTFALENNLDGYGQNSLPIAAGTIKNDFTNQGIDITAVLNTWRASHTFSEVNTVGDPATLYYSTLNSNVYLNTNPKTIGDPYASEELIGAAMLLTMLPAVQSEGAALTAWNAYQAHLVTTVISSLRQGLNSAVDLTLLEAAVIMQATQAGLTTFTQTSPNSFSYTTTAGATTISGVETISSSGALNYTVSGKTGTNLASQNTTISSQGIITSDKLSIGGLNFDSAPNIAGLSIGKDGLLIAEIDSSQTKVNEIISENTDGSLTFTDAAGKTIKSYTSGQMTGGSIKVNGAEIDAYNSNNQIQNSTQDINLGGVTGALDKTYKNPMGIYSFTTIDIPASYGARIYPNQGNGTFVTGLNNNGDVIGYYTGVTSPGPVGISAAGFSEKNGTFTQINASIATLPQYPTWLYATIVGGVNDSGTFVGGMTAAESYNVLLDGRAFIGNNNSNSLFTAPEDVGRNISGINVYLTSATGINNQGTIIGNFGNFSGPNSGGFIDNNGVFSTVVNPAYQYINLLAISNNGTILGKGYSTGGANGYFTYANGQFTNLPDLKTTLAGMMSNIDASVTLTYKLSGINNAGVIVGNITFDDSSTGNSYATAGFVDNAGNISIISAPPNTISFTVNAINDNGEIAGYYTDAQYINHGFTATQTGTTSQTATSALDILSAGTVDLRTQTAALAATPTPINLASGNNTVYFGGASETIIGANGYNSYNFTEGNGAEVIQNGVASATTSSGELDFGASITASKINFARSGQDLIVSVTGTTDQVTINGWFTSRGNQLQKILAADGMRLTHVEGVLTVFDNVAQIVNDSSVFQGGALAVSDTAANIFANLTQLQTIASENQLASITLTDSAIPTWTLTVPQFTTDSMALGKITSAYNLAVTGATVAQLAYITANPHVVSITISDTAANVQTNIATLETLAKAGKITAITFSDSTKPTITLTAAQQTADADVLSKITSPYSLVVTGGTVTAAVAATTTSVVAVSDTAANVLSYLSQLQTQATAGRISSIVLTDSTKPTLSLTAAQFTTDATALSKITSAYNISVASATVGQVATIAVNTHVTSIAVTDTAVNVALAANLTALQTLASTGKLASIALTDTTTPTLSLTATQYAADAAALGKISSAYNLSISGVTAANAATVAAAAHVTAITVSDTAANVLTNIATLETLAIGTKLSSIALTDSMTPTLALTSAQDAADLTVLGKITSAYNLSVSGVLAANAASVSAQAHVTSETISDTAADIVTSIASLETLVKTGKVTSITLTDSTKPTITLTTAQQTADIDVLNKISSPYTLVVTGGTVTAAVAATATSSVAVSDTAANVLTYLSQLQTQAATGRISSIVLTDATTPTLALTAAQYAADTTVLSKITSAYNLSVSGVTVANAATTAAAAHVVAITVSDNSANILANNTALQSLVTAAKLTSITLTDAITPTLALTTTQYAADTTVLSKIASAYNIFDVGVSAAAAANAAAQAHVTSVSVADTAADVIANLAALQTLVPSGKLTAIVLTDTSTPTITLTTAQSLADANVLNRINSFYNVAIADTQANEVGNVAALSGIIAQSHVSSFATGADTLTFASGALKALSYANGAFNYGLSSAATGTTESVSWNPTTGKAILNLTTAGGGTFSTSLGYINPGYVLNVSSASITDNNASGQALYTTQVNSDGSQNDISYDASGSAEYDNVYKYNAAGATTQIQYNNTNGTAVYDFFNPAATGDPQVAQQLVNADGSGKVIANNLAVSYVNGDAPAVSVGTTGGVSVSVPHSAGSDLFTLAPNGLTTTVGGHSLIDTAPNLSVAVDGSGNAILTSGGSTLTEAASGSTDTFVIGQDTISLAASAVTSVLLDANGAYDFALNSAAPGYSESLDWNPNTGKAILVITNLSANTSFATSLGYINPGYILTANSSTLTNANGTQALYTTQVNADGSQNDISYNTGTGTWKDNVYVYNSAGAQTEIKWDNIDGSSTATFYNPQNGAVLAQEYTNANGTGGVSWGSNAITFAPISGSLQNTPGSVANKLNIGGTGSESITGFTATDSLDFTGIAFGANTTLGFTENTSNTYGTLTISDGTHTVAIQLMGQYAAAGFGKATDTGAGTLVTYVQPVAAAVVLAAAH